MKNATRAGLLLAIGGALLCAELKAAGSLPAALPSPVHLWSGEGDARDSAGGDDGVLSGGVTFAPGRVRQAFKLDLGSIAVPNEQHYDFGSSPFSIAVWVKTPAGRTTVGNEHILSKSDNWGGGNDYVLYVGVNDKKVHLEYGHYDTLNLTGQKTVGDDAWHFIVVTSTGVPGTTSLYVDGVLDASRSSVRLEDGVAPLRIGSWADGQVPYKGLIDELAVYDRALTADERRALFVLQSDATPPQVTIHRPAPGTLTNLPTLPIEVGVVDLNATHVEITPGLPADLPPGGGTVVSHAGPLVKGINRISVVAEDAQGLATHATVDVVHDPSPPVVRFLSPSPGSIFASGAVSVSVEVLDDTETSLQIAGKPFPLPAGGGRVDAVVEAPRDGLFVVQAEATDRAGNVSKAELAVVVDSSVPLASIEAPKGPLGGGAQAINVTLVVNDVTKTVVSSDPPVFAGVIPPGGLPLSGVWHLVEGWNTLRVEVRDETDRVGKAEWSIFVDGRAPVITPLHPTEGGFLRGLARISVEVVDPDGGTGIADVILKTDTIGGVPLTRGGGKAGGDPDEFFADVDTTRFRDGPVTLSFFAFDQAGNRTQLDIRSGIDNTPPKTVILEPFDRATVCHEVRVLAAISDEGSGVARAEIVLDGKEAVGALSGAKTLEGAFDSTAFGDGPHTISVRSVDAAGNQGVSAVEVVFDNTPPATSILSPAEGAVVGGAVAVVGEVLGDFASVELFLNGASEGAQTTPSPVWIIDTSELPDGEAVLRMVSRDGCGNESSVTLRITVDNLDFSLNPNVLNLKSKGGGVLTATLEGASAGALIPTEAANLRLVVPGGGSVQSSAGFGGDDATADADGDGEPELTVKFDRAALASAVAAGIASGAIDPSAPVPVQLTAGPTGRVVGVEYLTVKTK